MARLRLSSLARADLAQILATSKDNWGRDGQRRYAAALAAGLRKVAAEPRGPLTRDRAALSDGLRSLHLRYAGDPRPGLKRPVHILYFRTVRPGLVEIVRVLHERMEPSRHVRVGLEDEPP